MHYSDPINYHSKATSTSTSRLGKGIEGRKTSKRSKTHYIPLYPQPINEPTVFPASYKDGRDGNTTFYLFDMQTPTPNEGRPARVSFPRHLGETLNGNHERNNDDYSSFPVGKKGKKKHHFPRSVTSHQSNRQPSRARKKGCKCDRVVIYTVVVIISRGK